MDQPAAGFLGSTSDFLQWFGQATTMAGVVRMNAFEQIVGAILCLDGYRTRHLFHVPLTKRERQGLRSPTMPRPELDLIAYKPATNELLVVEGKSYVNSRGVLAAEFRKNGHRSFKRYKLFNNRKLWSTVRAALTRCLRKRGASRPRPVIKHCLAAGHIASAADRQRLHGLFGKRGWRLIDDVEIARKLSAASRTAYADDVAVLAAKILVPTSQRRDPASAPSMKDAS